MMRHYYILVLVMLLLSCKHQPDTKSKPNAGKRDSLVVHKDSIWQSQSAIVGGQKYTSFAIDRAGEFRIFYIKNGQGQIVYTTKDLVESAEFTDFDGDGYKDVLLETSGVDSGHQDLLLFDPKTKRYVLAGNCSNAKGIKHTKYYYSYDDCCMGRFWSSDLFFIDSLKVIKVGFIKYDDDDGLKFYKVNGARKILKKKWKVHINGNTPIRTGKHIDFDLGNYWAKNYASFIK